MAQDEKLTPERAVRLLRAKAGELEHIVKVHYEVAQKADRDVAYEVNLTADIALIASLLADDIERVEMEPLDPQTDEEIAMQYRRAYDPAYGGTPLKEGRPQPE